MTSNKQLNETNETQKGVGGEFVLSELYSVVRNDMQHSTQGDGTCEASTPVSMVA